MPVVRLVNGGVVLRGPIACLNPALTVQPEHHVIGAAGLDETIPPDMRPTAPIGVVRAACKAGKAHVHFGGSNESIALLLGSEETRQTLASAPPRKASPPQERTGKPKARGFDVADIAALAAEMTAADADHSQPPLTAALVADWCSVKHETQYSRLFRS